MGVQAAVRLPKQGEMTQGTIFSGAVAENYGGCDVAGLVITARCDAANDKVRSYNYIPLVSLSDWLQFDGRLIIAERLQSDSLGKLNNALKQAGFSTSILEVKTPQDILRGLFPEEATDKKQKQLRASFATACDDYGFAADGFLADDGHTFCLEAIKRNPGLKSSLMNELVNQKLAGYYFLDRIEPGGPDSGFVALIREIQNIPRLLAREIESGLTIEDYALLSQQDTSLASRLRLSAGVALPVGLLTSPHIEHLMQVFSTLFGRIGIPDPAPQYIASLWSRQAGFKETT